MKPVLPVLALGALVAGCAGEAALPRLAHGEATQLALSAGCVARGERFTVTVSVKNPTTERGVAPVEVHALQHGRLLAWDVDLAAGQERTMQDEAAIPQAGTWIVYLAGVRSLVPQTQVRVVDPAAGGSCA